MIRHLRNDHPDDPDDQADRPMTDLEKAFLAALAFLLLKGLLSPEKPSDRARIRSEWAKLHQRRTAQRLTPES